MTRPADIPRVGPAEVRRLGDTGALVLGVREDGGWTAGHISTAVHTPRSALDPGRVPADRAVVAVRRTGNRSGEAAHPLAAAGLEVIIPAGGRQVWAATGRPIHRDDGPGTVA